MDQFVCWPVLITMLTLGGRYIRGQPELKLMDEVQSILSYHWRVWPLV